MCIYVPFLTKELKKWKKTTEELSKGLVAPRK